MVPIILLAYLFYGIYVNLQVGLYIEEKTKYFPLITGAGALVNVATNLLLIPVLGIVGAALAVLASYMVMAAGIFIFAQRFYKIEYEYGKILKSWPRFLRPGQFTIISISTAAWVFFLKSPCWPSHHGAFRPGRGEKR